jgi:hypothetical protein
MLFVKFVLKLHIIIFFYNKLDKNMKFIKVSFATLALLGYVDALNIKSYQGIGDKIDNASNLDVFSEAHRYINAKGEPIVLAES